MEKGIIVKGDYAASVKRKKARKQKKRKQIIKHYAFQKNFHKDFIVIQKIYDFFLYKIHIAMNNVSKKHYFYK